jgi:hypothetical protein
MELIKFFYSDLLKYPIIRSGPMRTMKLLLPLNCVPVSMVANVSVLGSFKLIPMF